MIVVLSGEGPTDLGQCDGSLEVCEDPDFQAGPMTVLLEKMLEVRLNYSLRTTQGAYIYVSEGALSQSAKARKRGRNISLVGKKRGQELGHFFVGAWTLAHIAKSIEAKRKDQSIAVLFRDCDGTRSSKPHLWTEKWQSMIAGFERAEYSRGVPMIPKPKSEGWLLCQARQTLPDCACLEAISGNDASPNSAKMQLDGEIGAHMSRQELSDWLDQFNIDEGRWSSMPSFDAFRRRLDEAVSELI